MTVSAIYKFDGFMISGVGTFLRLVKNILRTTPYIALKQLIETGYLEDEIFKPEQKEFNELLQTTLQKYESDLSILDDPDYLSDKKEKKVCEYLNELFIVTGNSSPINSRFNCIRPPHDLMEQTGVSQPVFIIGKELSKFFVPVCFSDIFETESILKKRKVLRLKQFIAPFDFKYYNSKTELVEAKKGTAISTNLFTIPNDCHCCS
jgi:hypothetical protein